MNWSKRTQHAVRAMRHFQEMEEIKRADADQRTKNAKAEVKEAYRQTGRNVMGNLDEAAQRRALADRRRLDIIGDEQFFRDLTKMYASIAAVEIELDKARQNESSTRVRDVNAPCPERTMDGP